MGISAVRIDSQLQLPWAEDGEMVLISVRDGGNVEAVFAGGSWCKYAATYRESKPSDGVYTQGDYKITFSAATFTDFTPKVGDYVWWEDLDCEAVVLSSVIGNGLLRFYDLSVRDLVLAYDLRYEATIYRPTVSHDASGLRSVTFTAIYADVPAAIHEEQWNQETTDDQLMRVQRYTVYLGTTAAIPSVAVKAGDVVDIESVRYEIVGQVTVGAIDTLTTLSVVRKDP